MYLKATNPRINLSCNKNFLKSEKRKTKKRKKKMKMKFFFDFSNPKTKIKSKNNSISLSLSKVHKTKLNTTTTTTTTMRQMSFLKSLSKNPEAKFSDHSEDTRWDLTKSMENPTPFWFNLYHSVNGMVSNFFNSTETRRLQALTLAETTVQVINQNPEIRAKFPQGVALGADVRGNLLRNTNKDQDHPYDYELVQSLELVDASNKEKVAGFAEALGTVSGSEVGYQTITIDGKELLN
jgi:hypothetical protein